MADYNSSFCKDAKGNTVWFNDKQARARLDDLEDSPIGTRIISDVELDPADLPEGKWRLESHHNFNGDFVYTRFE